jgi:hypothetical protein
MTIPGRTARLTKIIVTHGRTRCRLERVATPAGVTLDARDQPPSSSQAASTASEEVRARGRASFFGSSFTALRASRVVDPPVMTASRAACAVRTVVLAV